MRSRASAALLFLAVLARPAGAREDCVSEATLCLGGGRFLVTAAWKARNGSTGLGQAVAVTPDSGYFWFFDPDNVEVLVKALDGCAVNGHFWFFSAGLTNLEVELTVTDTATGEIRTYDNPLGTAFAPALDTLAFGGCPAVSLVVTLSRYQFSPGGPDGPPIRLQAGVTYEITFRSIDVEHGISSIPQLGIDGRRIAPEVITPLPSRPCLLSAAATISPVPGSAAGGTEACSGPSRSSSRRDVRPRVAPDSWASRKIHRHSLLPSSAQRGTRKRGPQ